MVKVLIKDEVEDCISKAVKTCSFGAFEEIPSAIRMGRIARKIRQLSRTQEFELMIRDLRCQTSTSEPLRNETRRFNDLFFEKFYDESGTVHMVTNEAISLNGSINQSSKKENNLAEIVTCFLGARVMSKGFARADPKVLIRSKEKRFALCSPSNTQRTIKSCTTGSHKT